MENDRVGFKPCMPKLIRECGKKDRVDCEKKDDGGWTGVGCTR